MLHFEFAFKIMKRKKISGAHAYTDMHTICKRRNKSDPLCIHGVTERIEVCRQKKGEKDESENEN